MSWCPSCKLWVPENRLQHWIADSEDAPLPRPIQVGSVIRMCDNCVEGQEVFSTKKLVYEDRERVVCPFCESRSTTTLSLRDPENKLIPDLWKCRDCGETFVL